jgi:hypothetical protein
MLWIPTTLTERQFWAAKIYGVADPESYYPPQYGGKGRPISTYYNWFDVEYLRRRPKYAPLWRPFWKDYGFSTEEELDAFLNQYAYKLKNFDWTNVLNAVLQRINEQSVTYYPQLLALAYYGIPNPKDIETSKSLYQMEYEHYLGPIKFALKYDKGFALPGGQAVEPKGLILGSALRQSLIVTLYDGTKLQAVSRVISRKYAGYTMGPQPFKYYWHVDFHIPLKDVLEIIKLPNVVSVEASDAPMSLAKVLEPDDAAEIWKDVKQKIYTNYVKYMQSPPPPTTQPGTQPSGTQPSGAAVTAKTWTWIAIGGGAILLLLLLTRRK